MRKLITPQRMLECEREYFRTGGVPSIEMMERAAQALADEISASLPAGSAVCFVCGTGGNGGDGTACARLLHERYRCVILQPEPPKSPNAAENLRRAKACGIPVLQTPPADVPDAVVDALFGTGLNRCPEGAQAECIRWINECRGGGALVYAADIPSGLNGETGRAYDVCVRVDRTVTFQYEKTGLTLADGLDLCGKVTVADIGFPDAAFGPDDTFLVEPSDLRRFLPARRRNIHKGSCGHLLIVAGSFGMAGAATMCTKAALRSGAGLVTVACPRSVVPILQTLAPLAMCVPLEETDGAISEEALPALESALKGKDAAVIGCGLTRRVSPSIVEAVLSCGIPAVIDADAMNILSENRSLAAHLKPHHILTPHPGEAKRLIPELAADDPVSAAKQLTGLGATVLFKGAASVIASPGSPQVCVSASGGCGMARGGSGDILSGILGALLAEKTAFRPAETAACASELHGLAGELAQKKYGSRAMNAADILEFLPEAFMTYAE